MSAYDEVRAVVKLRRNWTSLRSTPQPRRPDRRASEAP
jgi:hypothetical protein